MEETATPKTTKVTFSTQPLKLFGTLFNHPYPVDLSIQKFCYQGCAFCFSCLNKIANNNTVGSSEDCTPMVMKKIQKANSPGYNPESPIEFCIHHKYPIVFSNNVDPFLPASESRFKIGERILKECLEYKQPLQIQTKEVYTPNVLDHIVAGKDMFNMYVSISTYDYDLAKRYETVAITPEERLKRVAHLAAKGVKVCVAINPYVPEWIPDINLFLKKIKDSGAMGIYTDPLHLTPSQKKATPKRMGQFINEKSNRWDDFFELETPIISELAKKHGLKIFHQGKLPDDYYNGNSCQLKTWPFDAYNMMVELKKTWDKEKQAICIGWKDVDEFYKRFEGWNQVFNVEEFAGVLWLSNIDRERVLYTLGKRNNFKNIVRYVYNNPDMGLYKKSFMAGWIHSLIESDEKGEWDFVKDDNDDLHYVYDPDGLGFDEDFCDQNDPDFKGFIEYE